jgi:hypothetical protein
MSATHHRHLNLLTSSTYSSSQFAQSQFVERPNITDRFVQLLEAIDDFLLNCTYAEMCNFWNAIANLRQKLQKYTQQSPVPFFLTIRRKQRDFCRILEVLADLTYPQLHLSDHLADKAGDRLNSPPTRSRQGAFQGAFANPHLATQR